MIVVLGCPLLTVSCMSLVKELTACMEFGVSSVDMVQNNIFFWMVFKGTLSSLVLDIAYMILVLRFPPLF